MNKFRILLSLLVIAGAVLFALRHRSLQELKSENARLRLQVEGVTNSPPAAPPAPPANSPETNAGLSDAERSELLRLRGQVGSLRRELAQATNHLAKLSPSPSAAPSSAPDEPITSPEEARRKMSAGRQWMLALMIYAGEHKHRLPATLAEAAAFAGTNALAGAEFEFVRTNLDLQRVKSPATTIVLRETASWKTYNGKWNRTYAFADGHIENAVSDTNDFTDWEAKHQAAE